jgi:dolichol-phosphate mannosyltransferase
MIGMLSLSVFILAYNEAQNIKAVAQGLHNMLATLGRPYELVIIDDGSTDGTAGIADDLARQYPRIAVIHHEKNLGLGSAYKTALANAHNDLLTFTSADGQFPPEIIRQFLSVMDGQDMVLGYLPHRKRPLIAEALSAAERILLSVLFGPFPKFQGMMMFRRKILQEIPLQSEGGRGWIILTELIIRTYQKGYRVLSVPTEIRERQSGRSKVNNWRTIWQNFRQVVALRARMR